MIRGARQLIIGCSSKRCCGLLAQAVHGGICQANLAPGTASINALPAGHEAGYGIVSSRNWRRTRILKKCLSTARLFARISTRRAPPKKRGPSTRTIPRRAEHQDSRTVEGLGSLARFRLTGGEAGDSPEALPLLGDLQPDSLSADKAYDTDAILDHLSNRGIDAVIPPRSHRIVQRPFDQHKYKNRNLVERFFCRIKQFRRIATRYDKLAERFASFVALTAAFIWLS